MSQKSCPVITKEPDFRIQMFHLTNVRSFSSKYFPLSYLFPDDSSVKTIKKHRNLHILNHLICNSFSFFHRKHVNFLVFLRRLLIALSANSLRSDMLPKQSLCSKNCENFPKVCLWKDEKLRVMYDSFIHCANCVSTL